MTSLDERPKPPRRRHNHVLRYIPDHQLLEDRKTMSLREMGRKYGVVPSTVSVRLKSIGAGQGTRPRYADLIPWTVITEHSSCYEIDCLRLLGQIRAGKTLRPRYQRQVTRWLTRMVQQDVVVDYTPEAGFSHIPAGSASIEDHPYYEESLVGHLATESVSARSA